MALFVHHILHLDGNPKDLLLVEQHLKKENIDFVCFKSTNEQEFRYHLENSKIDLILSESELSGYSGFNALELVKAHYQPIPFIFVSGQMNEDMAIESLRKGATDYVLKNKLEKLGFVVSRALRESDLMKEYQKSNSFLSYHDKQLKQLVENMNEGVLLVDNNDVILFVNKKTCELTGYLAEELIAKTLNETLFSHISPNYIEEENISTEQKKHKTFEFELVRKDKRKIWIRISGSSLYDINGSSGSIHIFEDINERKKNEHELRKLTRAVNQSPESIVITDAEGIIEYANPVTFTLTGYSEKDLIGQKTSVFSSWEKSPQKYEQLWSTIRKGKIWKGEFQNKKKNGDLYWESATISPVLNSKNEITHYLAIKEDITERRKLNTELLLAKEKAEESDRLKSAFLSNISHEIRTPMNGIFGFAELLKTPDLPSSLKDSYITIIEQSGQRMLNIINDIVDISKIESGQMEIQIQEIHLNQLLRDLAISFTGEAKGKGLRLSIETPFPDENSYIQTDLAKLTQVLSNLINNAMKFTKSGAINFGYIKNGSLLQFYVKDTGVGISDDQIKVIFDRFRQGSDSLTRAYEGSGLGLSISKSFIEMLGGKIWVESEVGQGSIFYFQIPFIERKAVASPLGAKPEHETAPKPTLILIVEDDINSLMFLKTLLKLEGLHILDANNGLKAIEVVKNNPEIDLVLIDMKMPEMDGFEATIQIKKLRPDLPVIAQTAYALKEDVEKAKLAGCNDYILKPVKKQLLMEKIRKLI
ncbi:MAG: PAS domain S-box protein [Prolixibacteraceae bacterium]|nr:PAS domain S-box protein [Prolixibacteraceae bacterium]